MPAGARPGVRRVGEPIPPDVTLVYSVAMTFNPNAEIRSDNVSRSGGGGFGGGFRPGRGGGGVAIGGGGGCLLLVVILVYMLMGGDPGALLGGSQPQPGPVAEGGTLEGCETGQDANERDDCLVQATIESADLKEGGAAWREKRQPLFTGR